MTLAAAPALAVAAYTPEPPEPPAVVAGWNRQLRALCAAVTGAGGEGPDSRAGTLHVYWEPGEWWHPIGRWIVAEVTPRNHYVRQAEFYRQVGEDAREALLFELDGPSPREGGHYDVTLGKFVHDPSRLPPNITQRQWLLWRDPAVGGLAHPMWVVQGTTGGHKLSYNRVESTLNRLRGRPGEPPDPGALPYAPVDARTFAALETAARLSRLDQTLSEDWVRRELTPDAAHQDPTSADRRLLRELDAWLGAQVEATLTTA